MNNASARSATSAARFGITGSATEAVSLRIVIIPSPWRPSTGSRVAFSRPHTRKLRFFHRCEIETGCNGELLSRAVLVARPPQRFAPLQMQPAPVGRVFVGLLEFR